MTERSAAVTLAAEIGGPDADLPTRMAHCELRRLLRESCIGPYSPEVVEFAPILRIDGNISRYTQGLAHLRRNRKGRYITIDIGVPRERWEGRSEREIREHLATMVEAALHACIKRLLRDKTLVNGDALMHDYERVTAEYLKDA